MRLGDLVQVIEETTSQNQQSHQDDVVVSAKFRDDAAVLRWPDLSDTNDLVFTTDVITPIVDDPEIFGEIAATNALSDIYAMGGTPLYALNLAFFPSHSLPLEVLTAILRGGLHACRKAKVAIVGGHTVRNEDIKYGLAVTGRVREQHILSNRNAVGGQSLVLTKALGTGILGAAIKAGIATREEIDAAIQSMTIRNEQALRCAQHYGVKAGTDVTGFGLLGHLSNLLLGSQLTASIDMAALPVLPGAVKYIHQNYIPGGSKENYTYLRDQLRTDDGVDDTLMTLAVDAQTSGGLLLCVHTSDAKSLTSDLCRQGLPARIIGSLAQPNDQCPVGTMSLRFS